MQGNAKQRYSKNTWWCNDRTMLSIASAVQPEWLSKDCWVSYHSKCKFHWCVITERFWWWQFENKRTSTIYKSSFMSTSWSEEYRSLVRHWWSTILWGVFKFLVMWLSTLYGNGLFLDSMPSSPYKRWWNHHLELSLSESQGTYAVLLTLSQFL